jgi:hypothetical protein
LAEIRQRPGAKVDRGGFLKADEKAGVDLEAEVDREGCHGSAHVGCWT